MRRAILLVDHGSRREEANAVVGEIAELIRKAAPECIVRIAHMELAAPTVAEAIAACATEGADEIVVHPYFLGPGTHTTRDIPRQVREAGARHPTLEIRISDPLGPHPKIAEVVLERVGT